MPLLWWGDEGIQTLAAHHGQGMRDGFHVDLGFQINCLEGVQRYGVRGDI